MNVIGDGFSGYLLLLAVCLLAHEPWRWLGLAVGRNLDADSPVIRFVRAVSTALVAALVVRLVLFPAGVLESVPLAVRLAAFAVGLAVFFGLRQNLAAGVLTGALVLAAGQFALS